ncbi:hypothetical protein [Pseudooceanicola nanhaiensis]|uniref:Uncharacterized protein n=1 Tax=Pseudooceanicola nanhaiensis TaxID=375761 RepID=A0A917T2V2_9RHOB|nr:hypothetical protein [Pseudooceanicola nanhaiensis]GGM06350.1 hypothetical protein GCM10011534_30180 [Pseudooceanicola nanhaiensis]
MTIAYLNSGGTGELLVRLEGHVSRAENARALRAMVEDRAFRDLYHLVIDVRDMMSTELSSVDMKWLVSEIGRQVRRNGGSVEVRFLAQVDSFGYAMARVFLSYASLVDIFRIDEIATAGFGGHEARIEALRREGQVISA